MNEQTLAVQPAHNPWQTMSATIKRVAVEAPGVKTYDLAIHGRDDKKLHGMLDPFTYLPGQFNMLYVPGVGEAAISIAGRSQDGLLRHTIRTVGSVTSALEQGGVGLSLGLRGPFGTPWPIEALTAPTAAPHVILVAGGIGLAPLRSVIDHLIAHRNKFGTVDVLIGARSPDDLIYNAEYSNWTARGIGLHTTVDRAGSDWKGHVGVVTLLLDRLNIPDPESALLMTCGPEIMMRFVVQSATARGLRESNTWVTMERNMNCAIGLCGHCQLGPEFICKDGPVFPYQRIAPWLHVRGL